MGSFGGGSKSKARAYQSSQPKAFWLPGQEAAAEEMLGSMKRIFEGDLTSPFAKAYQTAMSEAAMRARANEMSRISGMRGFSTPAKQKAIATLAEAGVSELAKVPQQLMDLSYQYLSHYTLTPPQIGQQSVGVSKEVSRGAPTMSLCSCYIFRAGDHFERAVREYRDLHFSPDSAIAIGYKNMSQWLVPLMKRYASVRNIVIAVMLKPLALYARWFFKENGFGFVFLPFAYFWVGFWRLYGKLKPHTYQEATPRTKPISYRSITQSLILRLLRR